MRLFWIAVSAALVPSTSFAKARDANELGLTFEGVTAAEGRELIGKLQELKRKVREGEPIFFALHSGGGIGHHSTQISPRQLFLELPFEGTWNVSLLKRNDSGRKLYSLLVANPAENLWCTVAVRTWHSNEKIAEVNLDCGGPPPGLPPPPPPLLKKGTLQAG